MHAKAPVGCKHLDHGVVERVLAKHYGDIAAAAKELGVSKPDLNRLTWSKPQLLEEAELARMGVIALAWSKLIDGLDSDDPHRQMWAAERIMASRIARDHLFAPAARTVRNVRNVAPAVEVRFQWAGEAAGT